MSLTAAALHADPEFRAKNAERMKALNADPEFRAKLSKGASERMKALHADPEFRAKNAERMKALNADPEFRAKLRKSRLHWCPESHVELYRDLVKKVGSAKAKRIVIQEIARAENRRADFRATPVSKQRAIA